MARIMSPLSPSCLIKIALLGRDWGGVSGSSSRRESRQRGMAQPRVLAVSFAENYAVLSMKNGENRIDINCLKQFNSALDEIERYLLSCVVVKL